MKGRSREKFTWENFPIRKHMKLISLYITLAVFFIDPIEIEKLSRTSVFFFNRIEFSQCPMEQYENYEIVRVNSESREHPAANIKKSKGKWETDGEAARALLELSFKKPIQVGGVRVENVNSAFIEILVRNEGDKEFQVCLK